MKVKATTNFAGEICMARGDVRDVPESVAAPLLECGYLEALEALEPVQTSGQKDEHDSEAETTQEPETETKKTKRAKAKTEG